MYLQRNDVPRRSIVFLNPLGGNLMGGIKLGKVIRKWGLFTYIGRKSADPEKHIPGECYSACALSFLGGEYRFIVEKSVYGVHRFSLTSQVPDESDIVQIMSASVVQYIRDMEVNTEIFSIMTQAPMI
jgi:hypothetical protein